MKKETFVLILVICALGAYLVLHSGDRSNYTLPALSPVETGDITSVTLEKQGRTLELVRSGEGWTVSDRGYPVDVSKMDTLLGHIGTLEVTALVSESRDLQRYDLDPGNRITVRAGKGDTVVRAFEVGKAASTFRHTFVRLDGHEGVYHASRNFRRDFDTDMDGIRDKKVLSFATDSALRVTVEKQGLSRSFDKKAQPEKKTSGEPGAQGQEPAVWTRDDGALQSDPPVDTLVSMLADFRCSGYGDPEAPFPSPEGALCRILIDMDGPKQVLLAIFPKNEQGSYPGISSGTPYRFLLDSYQAEDVVKHVDGLLGIKEDQAGETGKKAD
jgi:hypothetical protein